MIRIAKSGLQWSGSMTDRQALRAEFDQNHYLRFPGFVAPDILKFVQQEIDRGEFYERVHTNIGSNKELCMTGNAGFGALLLLMNDENLFELIQDITQCSPISCFEGRVYRFAGDAGHHDSWHSDLGDDRQVAVSINLSPKLYEGGMLQIRDAGSKQIVTEVSNLGWGDALVFKLSPQLQHRITEVKGVIAKTAFAGWFRGKTEFLSLLKSAPAEAEPRTNTAP
jgi:hypothetical protein